MLERDKPRSKTIGPKIKNPKEKMSMNHKDFHQGE